MFLIISIIFLKDDIPLINKSKVRTYVINTKILTAKKSWLFVENNGFVVEQNPFITPKKKKYK